MQVRSITLVRHGRTSYNAARRIQGWVDIPLDEVGLWQVNQTGAALEDLYVKRHPDVRQLVVSSDLQRSLQTAHAFADRIGVEVHADQRLRERHFGEWEGKNGAELAKLYPDDYALWCRHAGGELHHGAETHSESGARGLEALQDWAHQADEDTDLYIFSHGALIENMLQLMFGIDQRYPDFLSMTSMRNAHWARLDRPHFDIEDRWILVDLNHGPALADTELWENPPLDERE